MHVLNLRKSLFLPVSFLLAAQILFAQSYNWPAKPFDVQNHSINGTFCENRPSGSVLRDHFHDGVDVGLVQGGEVYSVISAKVTALTRTGGNAYIRIGRYAYVHVVPNPSLDVGDDVVAYETIIGTTNEQNHIHFKDGYSGSEINAIRDGGGISPLEDNYLPTISYIKFYINKSNEEFTNNRVSGLVDIVSRAYDRTNEGYSGSNNGVYRVSYQIFDSTGTVPVTNKITPYKFDQIPSHNYVTNVFFEGSDLSTYIYNVTNQVSRDSYWDTREVEKGFYRVMVEVEDTRDNITQKWTTVEVVAQDKTAPETPELISLIGNDQQDWTMNWYANDSVDVDGYNLFFSYWGDNWNENPGISEKIGVQDTSLTWENFSNNVTIFFRLVAFDDAGPSNFSDSSDVYGIRLSEQGPQALIVDGFDRRDGFWNKQSHPFVIPYGLALTDMDIPFNTTSDDAVRMGQVNLLDYPRVFYMLGDEQDNEKPFDSLEQQAIKNYMQGDGMLVVSGSRIGSAMADLDQQFYNDVLHAGFAGLTETKVDSVYGEPGTPFEGFKAAILTPADTTLRLEVVEPFTGGQQILRYSGAGNKGAAIMRLPESSVRTAILVYLAFPYELIVGQEDRNTFMKILASLHPTAIENHNIDGHVAERFALRQNYPNPFNPSTTIRFTLAEAAFVKLTIYDRTGRRVRELFNGSRAAGSHALIWDGKNNQGADVSSGVYFLKMNSAGYSFIRKMMLLR